ncbi:MAG: trypsin-like peptidase domain-containing protein [Mycobacteriaceae bacterium]
MREVLFGARVHPRALVVLGVVALLVGVLGGGVVLGADRASRSLTDPSVTLAQVQAEESAAGTDGVAAVAAAVLPAVVSVESRSGSTGGTGSGVVIDGAGYIVTNNHVISQAANDPQNTTLYVVFSDGTRAAATIVGRDTKTDLAVLQAKVTNPTVAQLGRSADLAVGDRVIAIGSPLGLAGTVTTGVVSAVDRPVRLAGDGSDTNAVIDAVQTDAAINPGNSGGPLVDLQGRVVAINSAIRTSGAESGGSIGLGFAIPVDEVAKVAQELIRTGRATHPELGVNARSVTDGLTVGAQVANVQDGSPAAAAGVREGDVIIKVGDRKIVSADELSVAVMEERIGVPVTVQVVRAGRTVDLSVTLRSD